MTLVDALTLVPDPRRRQGCRYPFAGLLAVAVVAVPCGARPLTGISRWARGSKAPLLEALGLPQRVDALVPATTTWGRVLAKTDGDALDDALTLFTEAVATDPLDKVVDRGVKSLAADGKTVCGAVDADGKQLHPLSVFRPGTGTVAAQRAVRDKATLRNLAISLARLGGFKNIAQAIDHYRSHPADALHLLGPTI